jgi:hypothetical protein
MKEWKTSCTLGCYEGFAHIVEQEYDQRFKVWYGCVDVLCNAKEIHDLDAIGKKLCNQTLQMRLQEGRQMTVHIQDSDGTVSSGSSYLGCHFVSHSPLFDPFDIEGSLGLK